jgi:16S rRNA (adenine1518-N6/adenine1519-N6)-dimethyltransferase
MGLINYDSPSGLRDFLDERGMGMRKKFGQNFLINPDARKRLLDALDMPAGERVWEIGPGLGAMTAMLLERGALVTAFEIDKGFSGVLRELFGLLPEFTLVEGDVLKTWPQEERAAPYLFGNLPYTIGAVLLADLIEKNRLFSRMVVTVQKEVGRRMAAPPGSDDYSSFSVLCASAYAVTPLAVLKGACFYPIPHVDSQGVRLDLRRDIDPRSYPASFRPLVRRLFASRRKTVRNNLRGFAPSDEIAMEALTVSGIKPESRAEKLSLEEFVALARALEDLNGRRR